MVTTRPSLEGLLPLSLFLLSPPEKIFLLLPIGRPFKGTHRSTIYRAFFYLFVSLGLGVNRHSYTHQCNYSSTQHPDTIFEIFYPHFSLPLLMMKPQGFYLNINKGIWLLALAERPRVFPIR